jgi:hypothetical protein
MFALQLGPRNALKHGKQEHWLLQQALQQEHQLAAV